MLVASGSGWMTGNSDVMGQGGLPAGQKSSWGKRSALPETRFWNRGCPTTPNWARPVKGACGAPDKRQTRLNVLR
jgi:hypothetical protein